MGINPGQMTTVFSAKNPVETALETEHAQESDSLSDTLHTVVADSAVQTVTAPPVDTLQAQMASIARERAELEKLRAEVSTMLKTKARVDSAQISSLAKMYDGVEPAQLAQMMASMDDSLVIAILPRLKSQKAGKILEQMPAERAARISSKLIGYN